MAGPRLTPSQRIGVAQGSNRVNSTGVALPSVANRTSRFYNNVIAAGSTLQVPITGTMFYVTVAAAPIEIKPMGGVFNSYQQGTGLELDLVNAFDLLEIRNPNPNPVVFQVFVGFDKFIDRRIFLNTWQTPQVAYPTVDTPNVATAVAIPDISGQAFDDINGNSWYAIARVALIVSNVDSGVAFTIQAAGATTATGPAICNVPPLTSIRLDVSGDYSLHVGGGAIPAIVTEIYQALSAE
jgi:hypothetical protein